jgi:hypothetical protein
LAKSDIEFGFPQCASHQLKAKITPLNQRIGICIDAADNGGKDAPEASASKTCLGGSIKDGILSRLQ